MSECDLGKYLHWSEAEDMKKVNCVSHSSNICIFILFFLAEENDTHKPGPDTLEEKADKNRFFAELEEGRTTSIDYAELNKGLNESKRASVLDNLFK